MMPERNSTRFIRTTTCWTNGIAVVERRHARRRCQASHEVPPRRFFNEREWATLVAICDRVDSAAGARRAGADRAVDRRQAPSTGRAPAPAMPRCRRSRECWRRGIDAIEDEAQQRYRRSFAALDPGRAGSDPARHGRRRRSKRRHGTALPSQELPAPRAAARNRRRSITRIRRPGARSASAARLRRAAMCGSAPTAAIPGKAVEQAPERGAGTGATMSDSHDPQRRPALPTAARPTCSSAAAGCRCANTARTRRSTSPSSAPAPAAPRWPAKLAEAGFSRGGVRRRRLLAAARGFRLRREGAEQALLAAGPHQRRRRIRSSSAPTIPAARSAARRCISRWWPCAGGRNGSRRAANSATAATGRSIGRRCGATTPRSRTR